MTAERSKHNLSIRSSTNRFLLMNLGDISWNHSGAGLCSLFFPFTRFCRSHIFIFSALLFFLLNGFTPRNRFAPVHLWFLLRSLTHYFNLSVNCNSFWESFCSVVKFSRLTSSTGTQKCPWGPLFSSISEMISSPCPLTSLIPVSSPLIVLGVQGCHSTGVFPRCLALGL